MGRSCEQYQRRHHSGRQNDRVDAPWQHLQYPDPTWWRVRISASPDWPSASSLGARRTAAALGMMQKAASAAVPARGVQLRCLADGDAREWPRGHSNMHPTRLIWRGLPNLEGTSKFGMDFQIWRGLPHVDGPPRRLKRQTAQVLQRLVGPAMMVYPPRRPPALPPRWHLVGGVAVAALVFEIWWRRKRA